ncbi:UV-B-induced protein At3g17800, chloroplastic [Selaginella moellendorffii]|nr:UV-B-induced protein At3g17800, chloroplastic [Selaginella moellendorffii]|eukprot:XP_002981973.2 UV-B-induced protein At3g17800, chloroplastic [Selaginella moellendorffii]
MHLEAAASICRPRHAATGKISSSLSLEGGSIALWSLASPSSCFMTGRKVPSFARSCKNGAQGRDFPVGSGNSIPKATWLPDSSSPPTMLFSSKKSVWAARSCGEEGGATASSSDEDSHQRAIEIAEALVADRPIAPLEPGSPAGQFLMQTLKGNPHLFHAAAEQQLELLDLERRSALEQPNPAGNDHILYKRIAQLKSEERRRAVQEVIYVLVVEKFLKAGIKMVPKISALVNREGGSACSWPIQEKDLESVHSPEAFEMIKEHMEMVLGGHATLSRVEPHTVAQISKLRVGQIYATSVMYGYFLKRVDERYQLEKKMKILTRVAESGRGFTTQFLSIEKRESSEMIQAAGAASELDLVSSSSRSPSQVALKNNDLRAYVAKFDHETLSRYATMRTHETVDLIERHAEALFGRPDLRVAADGSVGLARDDAIQIKFASLRALVMEAAAFGSYLWDVESYVDIHYRVVPRRN